MGHFVTQFQGQILRAVANNRVCGHTTTCGHAPTSPTHVRMRLHGCEGAHVHVCVCACLLE